MSKLNQTKHIDNVFGFGYFDSKGRELGSISTVYEFDDSEEGHVFAGVVHGSRDGSRFGPVQSHNKFKTKEERSVYIARRIADLMKKAAK